MRSPTSRQPIASSPIVTLVPQLPMTAHLDTPGRDGKPFAQSVKDLVLQEYRSLLQLDSLDGSTFSEVTASPTEPESSHITSVTPSSGRYFDEVHEDVFPCELRDVNQHPPSLPSILVSGTSQASPDDLEWDASNDIRGD